MGKSRGEDASLSRRDALEPVAWNALSLMRRPGVCWPVWKQRRQWMNVMLPRCWVLERCRDMAAVPLEDVLAVYQAHD